MKKFLFIFISLFLLASCGKTELVNTPTEQNTPPVTSETQEETISVTSSIIPVSSVINTVGGEYVDVYNVVPAGVSPHGFDMSAQDMATLESTDIVFLLGLEHIDGFLEKAVKNTKQVHLADGMELLEAAAHNHDDEHEEEGHHDEHEEHSSEHEEEHHDEHEDHDDHEEEHDNENEEEHHDEHAHDKDPHVWLGKENIIAISEAVRDELSILLPEQAEFFAQNVEGFKNDIEALYGDFEEKVTGKTAREFIVFHDAYNYLMQSIGMDLNLKVPFSENVLHEVGTKHMAELIEEVELHGIQNIFSEPQFQSGNIEKFAKEHKLTLGILDPHGKNPNAGGYLENISNNLEALLNVYE